MLCSIPETWELPSSMTSLKLSRNQLEGKVTSKLLPASLQSLYLDGNRLGGQVPSLIFLSNLQTLSLANNTFSGPIPTLPTSLKMLLLFGNNLNGSLDGWDIASFTSLIMAQLDRNNLGGSIPSGWRVPATVRSLSIYANSLTGSIPVGLLQGWAASDSLDLMIYNNLLTGEH